jgi:small subunit ribosomal protein S1
VSLKVLEVDRWRKRVILSERTALHDISQEHKDRLLLELSEGDVLEGTVSGLTDFGAFVDIGGADGLVHISELSWDSINSPSQVVTIGDHVRVSVLAVDMDQRRIALSLRRLTPEPWATVLDRYRVGQVVSGTITKIVDFGAFARIDHGIEGLVHISELSRRTVNHPRDVTKEGDVVTLKILTIDTERRRMGLSLKEAIEEAMEA